MKTAALSDTGRQREGNEDSFVHEPERGFFAVIDGVGGYAGGEVAAEVAREALLLRLGHPTGTPAVRLREAISLANNRIYKQSRDDEALSEMACVLTAVVIEDDHLYAAHVGDTRLYKIREGTIEKLTRDHSVVGVREDAGDLTEAQAMRHPRRNEILRDVGSAHHTVDDEHFIESFDASFEHDAALLMCSDGLTDLVPAEALLRTVEQHAGTPEAAVQHLVDLANDAGGTDNITVLVIEGEDFGERAGSNAMSVADVEDKEAVVQESHSNVLPFVLGMLTMGVLALGVWFVAGTPFASGNDDTNAPPETLLMLLQNRLLHPETASSSQMLDASHDMMTGAMLLKDSLVLTMIGDTLRFQSLAFVADSSGADSAWADFPNHDSLAPMLYGYYLGPASADSVYSLGILLKQNPVAPPRLQLLVLPEPATEDTLAVDSPQ